MSPYSEPFRRWSQATGEPVVVGLSELRTTDLEEVARRYDLEFVAVFGSSVEPERRPRDLDLALMPRSPRRRPSQVELLHVLSDATEHYALDLVWLPTADWALRSQVARNGVSLLESRPGAFREFQLACYWQAVDSQWWRDRKQAYLDRFLNRTCRMDRDLITERLLQMTQYINELDLVLSEDEAEFYRNPLLHRTAERDIELLVECAARINTEVGESRGIPPSDYYSSFFSLKGDLDDDSLRRLADSARLRNLLVHQYERVELKEVYSTVKESLPLWREYLERVRKLL